MNWKAFWSGFRQGLLWGALAGLIFIFILLLIMATVVNAQDLKTHQLTFNSQAELDRKTLKFANYCDIIRVVNYWQIYTVKYDSTVYCRELIDVEIYEMPEYIDGGGRFVKADIGRSMACDTIPGKATIWYREVKK